MGPAAERLLARQAERVTSLGAVIDAKDFRRRGWVMATDVGGAPVKSVVDLHPADTLSLSFADGEASATITDVTRGEHP
jgi:exonuclease VII large subunit